MSNPDPRHRHLQDQDCPRGSKHSEHCIFTDLQPTKCFLKNHQHCLLPAADEVHIIDLDSAAATTPTILEPSTLTLVLEQLPLDSTQQQHHSGDDAADGDEESWSVCDWPIVPDLEARLYSPDLHGLVDRTFASPSPVMVPDLTSPCETRPATPSPSMMDIDTDWMPTNEEGMSILQRDFPSTPPPSDGAFIYNSPQHTAWEVVIRAFIAIGMEVAQ